jgi:hypothetical protein
VFSLPRLVRALPPETLQAYLRGRREIEIPDLDWEADKRHLSAEVVSFVQRLPRQQQEQILTDLEQVGQLCDNAGQKALRTMLLGDTAAFDRLDGNEARALYVLTTNPDVFRHALSVAYSERLYHGRSWSRYGLSQSEQPSSDPDASKAFEAELKELFINLDGSGRRVTVETFERPGDSAPSVMYSIFVESLPQSMVEFSEDGPQQTIRRPAIEAVVCYDLANSTLDIVAAGGKLVRQAIGEAFIEHFLSTEVELLPVSPRTFDLERFRRPMAFPTDPEDGVKDVSVTGLRLRDLTSASSRITIESSESTNGLHAQAEHWFGDANPLTRENWSIEHAKLQIVFHPERDGTRGKRITIELRAPNGSNLKEHVKQHELISSKYLARWGLIGAGQTS